MPTYGPMYSPEMADEFITVAQLRAEMAKVLARLGKTHGHVYVLQRGQPRAVLVDLKEYAALIEQLEYLDDSMEAILAHQRFERGEETSRPFDEVVGEIRARRAARKAKPLRRRARVSG